MYIIKYHYDLWKNVEAALNINYVPRYQIYADQVGDTCKIPKQMRDSESAYNEQRLKLDLTMKGEFMETMETRFTFKATISSVLPSTVALYTLAKAPVPVDPLIWYFLPPWHKKEL